MKWLMGIGLLCVGCNPPDFEVRGVEVYQDGVQIDQDSLRAVLDLFSEQFPVYDGAISEHQIKRGYRWVMIYWQAEFVSCAQSERGCYGLWGGYRMWLGGTGNSVWNSALLHELVHMVQEIKLDGLFGYSDNELHLRPEFYELQQMMEKYDAQYSHL